jgi:hypothetical protein
MKRKEATGQPSTEHREQDLDDLIYLSGQENWISER